MAATITASMAGELARKIVSPISKPNKDADDKFKALKENMDNLTERLDPESTEFKLERDLLIKQFKEDVGFDEFPIADQKKMIESINVQTGANYDALVSIQGNLNNTSSLLYKNLARQIGNIISTPLKAITFSKSVIEQLSETVKNKVANIAPIRAMGASFANLKAYIGGSLASIKSSVGGFLSNIKSGIASFGSKLAAFNPMGKIVEFIKKLFQPIIDAIKMVGKIIMDVLRFIMQVVIIAFQLLFAIISFLFSLTLTIISFLFSLTITVITMLFTLATTVITLLFSLATAIITGLIAIIGVIVGFVVSIALAALTLMASIFIFSLVTLTTVFLTIFAMFAFLIFTVMELLLVASLMALIAVATIFAIVVFLIPILAALLIINLLIASLMILATTLLIMVMVPVLLIVWATSIAILIMTGVLLFTMLFFIAPMIFGIMAYLLAVITPMLAFITLLCLISSIAGILIIAIVLFVAFLLYKAWQWATAFYEKHIKPWIDMVVGWFNKIWDWATSFYKDHIQPWVDEFKRLWSTYLQPVIDWITKTLMSVIGWIWDIFKSGWDFVSGIIKSIWEFISNPGKMIAGVASKVGSVVSESFSAVTDKLSSWGSSVVDAVNPMNWFAEGRIALKPMKAVFAEKGPEAAIPLDDRGLEFLRKTFNLDDASFNMVLNNSDLYKCVLDIKDQNIEIKEMLDEVDHKLSNMEKPSFYESVSQSYTNMFSPTPSKTGDKGKKESPVDIIIDKLMEIEKLIKSIPQGENNISQSNDSETSIAKMIATGLLGRR